MRWMPGRTIGHRAPKWPRFSGYTARTMGLASAPESVPRTAASWFCYGVLALAVIALLVGGTLRGARSPRGPDLTYLRTAGLLWLDGIDPYDSQAFDARYSLERGRSGVPEAFHNPPQFLPFAALLTTLGAHAAAIIVALGNTAGILLIAFLTARWALREPDPAAPPSVPGLGPGSRLVARTLLPALVLCLYAVHHLMAIGQISLITAGVLFLGWSLAWGQAAWQQVIGGALIGIATVKPQYAMLPLLWLLLDRRWWVLLGASSAVLVLVLPALVTLGPASAIGGWLEGLRHYEVLEYNRLGNYQVMGLPSLLAAAGVPVGPALAWTFLGISLAILWWLTLRPSQPGQVLALLIPTQMLFVYSKYLEIWLLAPMLTAIWRVAARRRLSGVALLVALGIVPVLVLPNALLARAGVPLSWNHVRTVVLVAGFALLLWRWFVHARRHTVAPALIEMPEDGSDVRLAERLHANRKCHVARRSSSQSCSGACGTMRTFPTTLMKFVSPFHRGTMWR